MIKERAYPDRKILKIFLPVIAGLLLPFLYDRIDSLRHPPTPETYGDGGMLSVWVANHIIYPIIIILLLLFQWAVIIPIWDTVIMNYKVLKTKAILMLTAICLLLGLIMGYLIWVPKFGLSDLLIGVGIFSAAQLIYWMSNIATLYALDRSHI